MRNRGNLSRPNSAIILAMGGRLARSSLHQPPSHVCHSAISSTGPEVPWPIVASRPNTVTYAAPCHSVYASLLQYTYLDGSAGRRLACTWCRRPPKNASMQWRRPKQITFARQFRSPQQRPQTPAPTLCVFHWMSRNEGSSQVGEMSLMTARYSIDALGLGNPRKTLEAACTRITSFVIASSVIRCVESLWSRLLNRVVSSAGFPHGHYLIAATLFQNTTHAAHVVPRHALASP
ncbi:hypothetical protein HDV63DRAFT_73647 [Trichoderma sp. SZMC 28014]